MRSLSNTCGIRAWPRARCIRQGRGDCICAVALHRHWIRGQERHGDSAHAHRVSPDRRHRRGIGHAVRRYGDRGTECGECSASRHRQSPAAEGHGHTDDRIPANMEYHRGRMRAHLWARGDSVCGGVSSAGIDPRHPVVDLLPAGQLSARFKTRHRSRVQGHGGTVQCGRRRHHRRRRAQPDDRVGRRRR